MPGTEPVRLGPGMKRVFISAGEPSGDLYACAVAQEWRKRENVIFEGMAGPTAGLPACRDNEDLRKDMAQLRRAVDRMGDCEHYSRCPVRAELQKQAGSGGDAGGED